jgi:hypothetical protein
MCLCVRAFLSLSLCASIQPPGAVSDADAFVRDVRGWIVRVAAAALAADRDGTTRLGVTLELLR